MIVFLLSFLYAVNASAQVLFFEPSEISLTIGEIFPVKIFINTEGKAINVISGELKFDSAKVKIEEMNFGGSVFSIIPIDPDISNFEKTASFIGAKPGGFTSPKALVAQINIKSIASGLSEIYFSEATVFLNDGFGTEIKAKGENLKIKTQTTFALSKDKIVVYSTTHPDGFKWYNLKNASVSWQVNENSAYSYEVSRDFFDEPDNQADEPIGAITLKNLPEGISYFHLKECLPDKSCGKKYSFRFQIDTIAPQYETTFFEIEGQKFLSILARDENSGVDKIEKFVFEETKNDKKITGVIGSGRWIKVSMPYSISPADKLEGALIFKVSDKAGNYQIFKVSLKEKNYFITGFFSLLIFVIFLYILYIFYKKIKKN